jgi:SAM-dependent methyltransferase
LGVYYLANGIDMKRVPHRIVQLGSWLWPQAICSIQDGAQRLQLDLYHNEYMLSTPQAIYSWGLHYKPFLIPFKKIQNELPQVTDFLLLGTGLGSALAILQKKYNVYPNTVLVDNSQAILDLSQHYMALNKQHNVQWVCNDAIAYLQEQNKLFSLIGIDIFTDMHVENQFKQEAFFTLIASHLKPGGIAVFNHVFASRNDRDIVLKRMQLVFSEISPINKGINTFTIARTTK